MTTLKTTASVFVLASALALGACETTDTASPGGPGATANRASSTQMAQQPLPDDPLGQATYWSQRYNADPENPAMAVAFSASLRGIGSYDEAGQLMLRTMANHPADPTVMAEYAKVLVETRRGDEAQQYINRAIMLTPEQWQLHSLRGVAYDQVGDYTNATQAYERALQISPNNAVVLNNYALSRALSGDLDGAEALLRTAVASEGSNAQTRQNLALVLGLQGNFEEARRIAHVDLPPQMAESNVEYYRAVLTQPAAWSDLSSE